MQRARLTRASRARRGILMGARARATAVHPVLLPPSPGVHNRHVPRLIGPPRGSEVCRTARNGGARPPAHMWLNQIDKLNSKQTPNAR